jgi:hypothetical protein
MRVFLPVVVLVAGLIYLAAQLPGYYWSYQICRSAWGLCQEPQWIPLVIGAALVAGFVSERRNRDKP